MLCLYFRLYHTLGGSRGRGSVCADRSGRGKSMLIQSDKVGGAATRCCAAGFGSSVESAIAVELLPLVQNLGFHSS